MENSKLILQRPVVWYGLLFLPQRFKKFKASNLEKDTHILFSLVTGETNGPLFSLLCEDTNFMPLLWTYYYTHS